MAGRRERFGGEPSGEPEWMREVGRGGLPGAHNKETSWPAAGFAAHNAQASKNKRTRAEAQAPIARRSPTHKSRAALADGANTHQRRPKGGKDGGGCTCGGSGNCNSEGGGTRRRASSAIGPAHSTSSASPRRTSRTPSVAELVALVQGALRTEGTQMTNAEVTDIVRRARAKALTRSRPSRSVADSAQSQEERLLLLGRRQP
jgi:hypothetical protein